VGYFRFRNRALVPWMLFVQVVAILMLLGALLVAPQPNERLIGLAVIVLVLTTVGVAALFERSKDIDHQSELREQRLELAHLSRVATLGELTGAVAHELNQPLTAILSNAEAARHLARSRPVDNVELQEALDDIIDSGKRAAAVIEHVRTLLKKRQVHISQVDVNEVLGETIALTHAEFLNKRISVTERWTDKPPLVAGDRVQLQQVILNLLLNARDAMEDNPLDDRRLNVRTDVESDGVVRIEISDNGTGIPSHDFERVFEPFFSSKRQGLGLGLAISRSIVTAHGGRMWAHNNAGRGATVVVTLPVAGQRSVNLTASPPKAAAR
jgi:C4-dicarboxylate-specific signal transduction histidine kinase